MKGRLIYIDQLKGIAIFLVVVGHFIQQNTIESTNSSLFSWIYSFHMPLFMFISGYVAYKTTHINGFNDALVFFKNKSIGLLIPYFAWPLIINNYFFNNKPINADLIHNAIALTYIWTPLWFLYYLFFLFICYFLFYLFSTWINKKGILGFDVLIAGFIFGGLVIVKFFHLFFPVDIDSFLLYYIFFFLGIFVSKFLILRRLILSRRGFLAFLFLFILFSGRYDFSDLGLVNKTIKMITAISAIASLYFIVNTIKLNPSIDRYVQLWGRYSIVIYTTHFTMIKLFSKGPVFGNLNLLLLVVIAILFAFLIMSACILILKVVKLSPPLDLILYGHRPKKVKEAD